MSNTNNKYYQRVYDKVNASEELKERLMDMRGENQLMRANSRKNHRMTWKVAAAALALVVAVPSGVYAAAQHFGVGDFFADKGHLLTKEANDIIETEIPQTPAEDAKQKVPVEFTVHEALCDSGTVSLVVEAKAKESGKYLLAHEGSIETDSVSDLGINSKKSIGEYAAEKGLEIIYVGTGFDRDSAFFPGVCSIDAKSVEDDTLDIFITADRSTADKNKLDVMMINTVKRSGSEEIIRSTNTFKLHDKSSSQTVLYTAEGKMKVKGTQATVTKVTAEKTEVNVYVKVYFTNPQPDDDEDGLTFRIRDNKNAGEWDGSGGYVENLGNGNYCQHLTYEVKELPEKCILEAFNCWEENIIYGQFALKLAE